MGSIFIIEGILIYIYAFDHNPPHLHVRCVTPGSGQSVTVTKYPDPDVTSKPSLNKMIWSLYTKQYIDY